MKFDISMNEIGLFQELMDLDDKNILELECGDGRLTVLLAEHAKYISGIDLDERFMEELNQKYSTIKNIHFHP